MKSITTIGNLVVSVESQVREFDAKLLLSCIAAERGFRVFIGQHIELRNKILGNLFNTIYISKALTEGHHKTVASLQRVITPIITGWDEEALVYYSPELYRQRRVHKDTLPYFKLIFAWGQDNKENLEYFHPNPGQIEITGNPRVDILRPEFSGFFDHEVSSIKKKYGSFILFNSNFGKVNPFNKLYKHLPLPEELGSIAADANLKNYDPDLAVYRHQLLDHFIQILPSLAEKFSNFRIIIRPHPAEGYDLWVAVAKKHPNIVVIREGNVIPWLKACSALIHNGCTTAVEAAILGLQPVSYRPISHAYFDPMLPNNLSYQVTTPDALFKYITVLSNNPQAIVSTEQHDRISLYREILFKKFVSNFNGPELGAERVISLIEYIFYAKILYE